MQDDMKSKRLILLCLLCLGLNGCAKVLPLNYTNYEGIDAATLYVLNSQGNVGTIYLASYDYNNKDSCYDMSDRYELDSNFFKAKGSVITARIKPGVFYSVSQIRNDGRFIENTDSSVIPEAGKSYYVSSGSRAVQVPDSFRPDASESPDEVVKVYGNNKVTYWNVKKICSRPFWKIG
ncbi:hypothetical protein GC090_21910 (plasmid) [Pantoea sp. JZ29]|nr:hypothetical protein GC090_21910 [Pantoea sp. JZ29]